MEQPELFSFHGGHSGQFCRHARGSLRDVVRAAVSRGFTSYGLSEHAPRFRSRDLFPDEQGLTPGDLEEGFWQYVKEARSLQTEFAGTLDILVGFETEVVAPDSWRTQMRQLRARGAFDYIVGSVHHVGDCSIDASPQSLLTAAQQCGGRDALDCAYFDLVEEMVASLSPEVVGHLDLVRKFDAQHTEFPPVVLRRIESALETIKATGAALDVNASPVRKNLGPVYPSLQILVLANAMEIPVTLGDDSHGPDDVGVGLAACVQAVAAAGYKELVCLSRRDGAVEHRPVALADIALS